MPKRIVDGEALWRSEKLAKVEPRYRAEYANLLPLADAQGTFDATPRKVWADVYSCNRTDVLPEDVERILDAFESAKMLFRWRDGGKVWGYFVGIDKPGRLPSPSRLKENHYQQHGPDLPTEQLHQFLTRDAGTCVGNHGVANGQPLGTHGVPNGSAGVGFGSGSGDGVGLGKTLRSPSKSDGVSTAEVSTPGPEPTGQTNDNSKSTAPTKNKPAPSPAAARLAALLRDEMLRNKPDSKITDTQVLNWSTTADRMLWLDERTEERIAAVIRWAQADEFELKNVRSMDKLRERFDTLELKARGKRDRRSSAAVGVHQPTPPEPPTEWRVDEPMDDEAGARLWEELKEDKIRPRVDGFQFDLWLKPTLGLGVGNDTGTIYVQLPVEDFAREMGRFDAVLHEVLPDRAIKFVAPTPKNREVSDAA